MSLNKPRLTFFVMMRALPAWLALDRSEREAIAAKALRGALKDATVAFRHFDAEAFTAVCSDVALFETDDAGAFYSVMERLRDTALFSLPYFDLVQIIPAIEDGFRQFEAQEAA